jgi:hypothetical protein
MSCGYFGPHRKNALTTGMHRRDSAQLRAAAGYKHEKTKSVAHRAISQSLSALVAEDDRKYHIIAFSD